MAGDDAETAPDGEKNDNAKTDADTDADADAEIDIEVDTEAVSERERELRIQLRVLRMRERTANFERKESIRREIRRKEKALSELGVDV
jgi:hypothetical protein